MSMRKAILEIVDEVNVKFHGLDVTTRRKMSDALSYTLPHAFHTPAYKLGRWDGKMKFCDIGARSYMNLLDRLLPIVYQEGYEVELVDNRETHNFHFSAVEEDSYKHILWPEGHRHAGEPIILRDYQVEIINLYLENMQGVQSVSTGAGKCQPYDSKILTPQGWTMMGEILPGDKVTVPDGSTASVLAVYEPGIKDVYEMTFKDGRVVRSCEDHIWPVYNIDWKNTKSGPVRHLTTREIMNKIEKGTGRCIGIHLPTFENDTRDIDLPLDPWLLGFLLGDGCFRHGGIGFSTSDEELVRKVESLLDEEYCVKKMGRKYDYAITFANKNIRRLRHAEVIREKERDKSGHIVAGATHTPANLYRKIICLLGLDHKLSHEKFIPDVYFRGSKSQRIALIQGLVDSDGTVDKKSIKFTSTSASLAKDFAKLVHSVGGIASVSCRKKQTYFYKGERRRCKDSYTVSTKYAKPWELVSLQRKKILCGDSYQYGPTLKNNIISVKKVSTEPVRCIMIDHPDHLYITDGYIITHNTLVTAVLSHKVEQYGRSIIIVPNRDLVTQTEKDYKNLGLDVGVLFGGRKEYGHTHTICTWQSLEVLNKKSKTYDPTITIEDFIDGVVCVIVDEAHVGKAEILRRLMSTVFANIPLRWGMTGTVPEEEYYQAAIVGTIGPVINHVSAKELQDKEVLANLHIDILQTQEPPMTFKSYQQEYAWLVSYKPRLEWLAGHVQEQAKQGNTLVLVNRIDTGEALQELIPDSVFVSGTMKGTQRRAEYDEVKTAHGKVIIATYGVAAVGIDIPRIFNLYLLEVGKGFVRTIQSIGRGIRRAEDKSFLHVFDICSNTKYSSKHITARKRFYKKAEYPYEIQKVTY